MRFLASLACLLLVVLQGSARSQESSQNRTQPSTALDLVSAIETVVSDAIARAESSVVAIHRRKGENSSETLAVRGRPRPRASRDRQQARFRVIRPSLPDESISFDFGSGVVIGDEGQILTAYHVVRGAIELEVRAADRQQFEAEIIAADPRSDLAVIAPVAEPGVPPPRLKPLVLGDATRLRKGAFLIALGNPFNAAQDGQPSASWGILSNIARRVEPEPDELMMFPRRLQFPNYPTLLQLDSKLNLGMSGGAVVNMRGELVGLTTMAASPAGYDAMAGYAIPIDRIGRRAIRALSQGKEIEYGLLGIRAQQDGTNRIGEVQLNSPADQGQLMANDEIIAVNDTPVSDFDSLILAVNSYAPGDEVRLKIRRDGKEMTRSIVLAKYPPDAEEIVTNRPPAWRGLRVDYMSTVIARGMGHEQMGAGVVITDVEENSPAAKAGLKKTQLIFEVDDKRIANPPQFDRAVSDLKGPVRLLTDQGPVTLPE
jgi:S1-C subfamily serine protease